jgi:hypothetical protein
MVAFVSDCSERTGPAAPHASLETRTACSNVCALLDDPRTLLAATATADSASANVYLGDVNVRGEAGDTVALALVGDDSIIGTIDASEMVYVTVGDRVTAEPLAAFRRSHSVFRFSTSGTVNLEYTISRNMQVPANWRPVGALSLSQLVGGTSAAIDARTPWVRGAAARAVRSHAAATIAADAAANTLIEAPAPGTYEGVSVSMTPYAPNDGPWTADFQSNPGHGQSHSIDIEFGTPVAVVVVTIVDPDFPGNTITAYDASGAVISTQEFGYDLKPGHVTTETLMVSGAISRIVLAAAPGDYVSYSMQIQAVASFSVACTPSSVVRGELITCAVADPSFGPYEWSFAPSISTVTGVTRAPTSDKTWSGSVAASGTVTVTGWSRAADAGVNPRETATAAISVTARAWANQPLKFPSLPSNGGQGALSSIAQRFGNDWVIRFGLFTMFAPKTVNIGTVAVGPNSGYAFVLSNVQVPQPLVNINNIALSPGSDFASKQTGSFNGRSVDPTSGLPYCTASALPKVRTEAERHEGLTGAANSHYGIASAQMATSTMSADIEAVVYPSKADAANAVFGVFNTWAASVKTLQDSFDTAENQLLSAWAGNCQLVIQP